MIENQEQTQDNLLEIRPLREQIYEYLRNEIQAGRIKPGEFIQLNAISDRLGVSKTPLRDALIQLECKGFVKILPRRGVLVNQLSLEEIRDMLQIVGALESAVLTTVFDDITEQHLERMAAINGRLRRQMACEHPRKFDQDYFELNLAFHDVFLNLSDNQTLMNIILPIKQRLYDFPRKAYDVQWELTNCDEHDELIQLIRNGEVGAVASLWQERHWSFAAHEVEIREYYAQQG